MLRHLIAVKLQSWQLHSLDENSLSRRRMSPERKKKAAYWRSCGCRLHDVTFSYVIKQKVDVICTEFNIILILLCFWQDPIKCWSVFLSVSACLGVCLSIFVCLSFCLCARLSVSVCVENNIFSEETTDINSEVWGHSVPYLVPSVTVLQFYNILHPLTLCQMKLVVSCRFIWRVYIAMILPLPLGYDVPCKERKQTNRKPPLISPSCYGPIYL